MQTLINSLNDIVGTDLLNGSVFHVVAYNYTYGVVGYELIGGEGLAWDSYYGYLANPEGLHPAVVVELALMDVECVPTWIWDTRAFGLYGGQFARIGNWKEVSDSGAYRLPT